MIFLLQHFLNECYKHFKLDTMNSHGACYLMLNVCAGFVTKSCADRSSEANIIDSNFQKKFNVFFCVREKMRNTRCYIKAIIETESISCFKFVYIVYIWRKSWHIKCCFCFIRFAYYICIIQQWSEGRTKKKMYEVGLYTRIPISIHQQTLDYINNTGDWWCSG